MSKARCVGRDVELLCPPQLGQSPQPLYMLTNPEAAPSPIPVGFLKRLYHVGTMDH